jgi:FkbH-like protein
MTLPSLNYPFDVDEILRRRKALRAELSRGTGLKDLRIAILGGSTTHEVRSIAELFLLKAGFRPVFLESEYGKYFEDVVVDDAALRAFRPEVAYIHTNWRNLVHAPRVLDADEQVERCLQSELARYEAMWRKLTGELGCVVIQNNFDLPPERSLGGLDATQSYGRSNFLLRLNLAFAAAARANGKLLIQDIHYLSAQVGLDRWGNPDHWFSYKLAISEAGTVVLAHSLARLVGAAFGRTRKCLVLDLDNTLWGGVIGDDGMKAIQIGNETPQGEAYTAFQEYCRQLHRRGILLAVASKNELANAQQGFTHPDTVLQMGDFTSFQANWDPKPGSLERIAAEVNIGLDSLVFVDDNPAERALVAAQLPMVAVPDVGSEVTRFAEYLDREGYFEVARISPEDGQRAAYYAENSARDSFQSAFASYEDFLASLDMKAQIGAFSTVYLDRICQLTNKTNQFNLTTRRYTMAEMEAMAVAPDHVTLYGRLEDRFGDNGLVSVVAGRVAGRRLDIELWLMSCRVLKRDMEHAMLDALAQRAAARGAEEIVGHYLRTAKNDMVADLYGRLGFELVERAADGSSSTWRLALASYQPRNRNIKNIDYV